MLFGRSLARLSFVLSLSLSLCRRPLYLPLNRSSQPPSLPSSRYNKLVWNKELIVPAAELFRFEIRGRNPDTAYTIYFAIGNPAVNPNYPIVPQNGIGFRTLDANTIEYAGSDTFPILGKDTTGLRVSVVLGASWHTTLSYVVRLGDGAWNANPAGKHSAETKREEMQGEGGRRGGGASIASNCLISALLNCLISEPMRQKA